MVSGFFFRNPNCLCGSVLSSSADIELCVSMAMAMYSGIYRRGIS
jgi:hypothetical protein